MTQHEILQILTLFFSGISTGAWLKEFMMDGRYHFVNRKTGDPEGDAKLKERLDKIEGELFEFESKNEEI